MKNLKKLIIISLLLLTGAIFQTQLFSYSGELIGDTKCAEINNETRYGNLSPTIIEKIDLIGNRINEKYELKDDIYKEKVYNLFEKVLNEHLQKTTYSEVQKEVLLRIGDYFVCKKENLNIKQESLELYNVEILNITDHSIEVIWEGNSKAETWLYVKRTGTTGIKHDAINNSYEYLSLGSNYEFTLFIQGVGSDTIKQVDFKTLSKEVIEDITIKPDTITDTTTDTDTVTTIGESKYLEEVNIPKYDSNNSSHVLITPTNGKWSNSVLNNSNYKHFYLKPGKYSSSTITLTQKGSASSRRSISLYNGNDIHPAALSDNEQANVRFKLSGGSYWDIDRISVLDNTKEIDFAWLENGASYNTINRLNLRNYYYGILIRKGCHYNSIQNSYVDQMTHAGLLSDNVGIALSSKDAPVRTYGNKILNNDIRNANDGIQLIRHDNDVAYDGTIIDSNRIWNDGDVYTNGDYSTNGYNADGEYQIGENAMDFKAGSDNPNNPVIVSNNIMWGYQEGDNTAGGGQSKGRGTAITLHYEVKNLKFHHNIIFDSQNPMGSSGTMPGTIYSMIDCELTDNIFYHSHYINPTNRQEYVVFFYNVKNFKFENNSIIEALTKPNNGYFFRYEKISGDTTFKNNLVIDADRTSGNGGATVSDNYYYDVTESLGGVRNVFDSVKSNAKMSDYTFTYRRFTSSPKTRTLKGVISTKDSPHYDKAGSNIK